MRIDDKDDHGSIVGKGIHLLALLHRVKALATAGRIQLLLYYVSESYSLI
jgi:hypothetical protein